MTYGAQNDSLLFMKNKLLCLALCVMLALLGTSSAAASSDGDQPPSGQLRFGADGAFTILVLSDAQETQTPSPLFMGSVRSVLRDYAPDLVVLLGDQLEGQHPLLRVGRPYDNVRNTITQVVGLLEEAGVPFAVVPGNHDYEAPVSIKNQSELYRSYGSLCKAVAYGEAARLTVYSHSGERPALNLYLFDSGKYTEAGGYGATPREQIDWYIADSEAARAVNGDGVTPAVAFSHVAVEEIYRLFRETDAETEGALHGTTEKNAACYLPDESVIFTGEALEAPCPSEENYGLFKAFRQEGDVFLTVFGHDHLNSFIGSLEGVDVAAAPGSTYTGYGDARARGVRLFRFTEDNIKDYETIHVRFSNYDGAYGLGAVRYYLTTTTRIPNTVKTLVIALLFLAAIVLLVVMLLKKGRTPCDDPEELEEESEPEDPYL